MASNDPALLVSKPVRDKGIDVIMAVFHGSNIVNKNGALERLKKEKIEKIASYVPDSNPILQEYSRLQREAGIPNPVPPARHIIEIVKANRRMPNINTVVDSYNIVSAETCLSIGAHDLDHIVGDVRFVITNGSERYIPLGQQTTEKVNPGEYACMDSEKIMCRLDLKQCNETKVTKETKRYLVYVQGNRFVPGQLLESALKEVCENLTKFCGGDFETIHSRDF
jgi:DNA/RNA-binding domain of Phe-tRNA-synthetase-like protein